MAEFADVVYQWSRMCGYGRTHAMIACSECPLGHSPVCGEITEATKQDILEAEQAIQEWAKAHPEPKYPRWIEWLHKQIPRLNGVGDHEAIEILLEERIPEHLAEMLEIVPEEDA